MAALLKGIFSFPHPVNEVAARLVAAMVFILTLIIIFTDNYVLTMFLVYGFLARVLTGPTLSPMGLVATKVIVPILGNPKKLVAGPPKRFAQTVGLVFTSVAIVFIYVVEDSTTGEIILGVLATFALMESALGFCAGCFMFGFLIKWGVIPEDVCERCANLTY
jgi:hypothetical protein